MKTTTELEILERVNGHQSFIREIIAPKKKGDNRVKIIVRNASLVEGDCIDVLYSSQDFDDWPLMSEHEKSIHVIKQRIELQKYSVDTDGSLLLCASVTFPLKKNYMGTSIYVLQRGKMLFMELLLSGGVSDRLRFHLPMPLFIANIGESYAAGLGTGTYDLVRDDEAGSFRSSLSGPELLMDDMRRNRPEYAIEYFNVAYAGARLGSFDGSEDKKPSKSSFSSTIIDKEDGRVIYGSQLKQVSEWLANHPLKPECLGYAFLSIGGNDMFENEKGHSGLARLMEQAYLNKHFEKETDKRMAQIELGLTQFSNELADMAWLFHQSDDFKATRFIYSTIPDATKDDSGQSYGGSSQGKMRKFTAEEMEMIFCNVLLPMNNRIREFCAEHAQFILNDVQDKALQHGDAWFNPLESFTNGGEHMRREVSRPIVQQ